LFTEFFNEELANKVEPEAARIGILGSLVAGVAFLAVLVPLLYQQRRGMIKISGLRERARS
jgi:hypothetical protein